MDAYAQVLALSAAQRGFIRLSDARLLGFDHRTRQRWVAQAQWQRDGKRLLRRTGTPADSGTHLMRVVLDAGVGAVLSGGAAVAWWGVPGYDLRNPEVFRPRGISGGASSYGATIHEVLDLSTDQVTVLDGIPILRPDRLAFELMSGRSTKRAARAIETMWAKNLLSGTSLRATFDELAGSGRTGTVAMRDFLEGHPRHWIPPASNLERRFAEIMQTAGLGTWHRQVDLGATTWVGRVDFLHAVKPVVVEVQSERYHTALLDRAADAARRARLEQAGFTVVEVWDTAIWHDRALVVQTVRDALAGEVRIAA